MKFHGPDHAVITAWEALRDASVAKGIDLAAMEGLWHAKACPRCRGTVYHETKSDIGAIVERCKRCGLPWPTKPACIPKGAIRKSISPKKRVGPVVRAGDILALIARVPEDTLRIYACWLISGQGFSWTAERAVERDWPGGPWNDVAVRRAVRRGRTWLRAELEASGLLQEAA